VTIELRLDDSLPPAARMIRVTTLESGKAISLGDEIHRNSNWYAIAPTVLAIWFEIGD
jgi:hypothetical protein